MILQLNGKECSTSLRKLSCNFVIISAHYQTQVYSRYVHITTRDKDNNLMHGFNFVGMGANIGHSSCGQSWGMGTLNHRPVAYVLMNWPLHKLTNLTRPIERDGVLGPNIGCTKLARARHQHAIVHQSAPPIPCNNYLRGPHMAFWIVFSFFACTNLYFKSKILQK